MSREQMPPAGKQDLREFTKSEAPDERTQLADQIKAERAVQFQAKEAMREQIRKLEESVAAKETSAAEAATFLAAADENIARRQSSLHGRAGDFIEQRVLSRFLKGTLHNRKAERQTILEGQQKELAADYQALRQLQDQLAAVTADTSSANAAKEKISAFYQEHAEGATEHAWEAYEYDQKVRDLRTVSKEHEVAFIHAVNASFSPSDNSPLKKGVNWRDKMEIFLALQPPSSVSSVKEGDSYDNMVSRMGFILRAGKIEYAQPDDAATVATGISKRSFSGKALKGEALKTQIGEAIDKRTHGYNEFSVTGPEAAAMYVNLDDPMEEKGLIKSDKAPDSEIYAFAQEQGLPVFVMVAGKFYRSAYNEGLGKFEPTGEPIKPSELTEQPSVITPEQKQRLLENVMEKSAFKMKVEDAKWYDGRAEGYQLYALLAAKQELASVPAEALSIGMVNHSVDISFGRQVSFAFKDRLTGERFVKSGLDREYSLSKGVLEQGGGGTITLDRPITSAENYLEGMQKYIDALATKAASADNPESRRYDEDSIKKLAFHLRGFAEAARAFGDTQTAEKATTLAETHIDDQQYELFLEARKGDKGQFKFTQEDLL